MSDTNWFKGFFYQTYSDIIHVDIFQSIFPFFVTNWLLPNQTIICILIPIKEGHGNINKYRYIALAIFQFKIITKVSVETSVDCY